MYSSNPSPHLPNSAPKKLQSTSPKESNLRQNEVSDFTKPDVFKVYQDTKKSYQAKNIKLKSKVDVNASQKISVIYQR